MFRSRSIQHAEELCGDPQALQWQRDLARGEWGDLGTFLRTQDNVETRDFYLRSLAYTLRGWPDWLDEWVERDPHDALPRMFRAWRNIAYAWEARGSRRARYVKQESWPLFFSRLEEADSDMAVAADLAPDDAGPWVTMITTARGRQLGIPELRRRFAEVERRHRWHTMASQQVLQGVAAKWGGTDEMMFAFAREICAGAPEGAGVHVLIADAHYERWLSAFSRGYWKRPEVRDEIVQAARRCFTSPIVTPRTVLIRQRFADCLSYAGEKRLQKELMGSKRH